MKWTCQDVWKESAVETRVEINSHALKVAEALEQVAMEIYQAWAEDKKIKGQDIVTILRQLAFKLRGEA